MTYTTPPVIHGHIWRERGAMLDCVLIIQQPRTAGGVPAALTAKVGDELVGYRLLEPLIPGANKHIILTIPLNYRGNVLVAQLGSNPPVRISI